MDEMRETLSFEQALNLYKIRYRIMFHNYLESLADPNAFITLENMYGRLMEMRYVLMELYNVTEEELEGLADDAKNDRPVIITRGDHIRTMTDEELAEMFREIREGKLKPEELTVEWLQEEGEFL
ncbi:MAG: hypothetical protein IKQ49_05945 [Eubacterium sp.]|nr:hypothetical protein [Eubacterium sp.]